MKRYIKAETTLPSSVDITLSHEEYDEVEEGEWGILLEKISTKLNTYVPEDKLEDIEYEVDGSDDEGIYLTVYF